MRIDEKIDQLNRLRKKLWRLEVEEKNLEEVRERDGTGYNKLKRVREEIKEIKALLDELFKFIANKTGKIAFGMPKKQAKKPTEWNKFVKSYAKKHPNLDFGVMVKKASKEYNK